MKYKIVSSRFIRFLASLRIVRALYRIPLVRKFCTYEVISYVIAGFLTTVVNYVVYFLMPRFGTSGLDIVIANIAAWIAAVLFAFIVNKIFVFDSPSFAKKDVIKELIPFIACRLLSLGFDTLFMYVTVGVLRLNEYLFKILSNVFVLLANYFASRFIIFKNNGAPSADHEVKNED